MLIAGRFLQRIRPDMMIGNAKAIRGDERATAAGIETDARLLKMLEPLRRRLEMIFGFKLLERWIVEQPHSFVSTGEAASNSRYHSKSGEKRSEKHRRF